MFLPSPFEVTVCNANMGRRSEEQTKARTKVMSVNETRFSGDVEFLPRAKFQHLGMRQNFSLQQPSKSLERNSNKRKKNDVPSTEENQTLIGLYQYDYLVAQEKGLQFNPDCWESSQVAFNLELLDENLITIGRESLIMPSTIHFADSALG